VGALNSEIKIRRAWNDAPYQQKLGRAVPCRPALYLSNCQYHTREGNQPRLHAKGFGENPAQMLFILKDITGCTNGTERINSLELFFKDSDHLIEKWETLKPDGMKTHFDFELTRKSINDQ
jgi:hypothetical protein